MEYANLGSGGTRIPRTNWSTLKQYPIAIPNEKIISHFNKIIEPTIDEIIRNCGQIRTLQSLRDTLLPKLISGEIRVKYDKEANQ